MTYPAAASGATSQSVGATMPAPWTATATIAPATSDRAGTCRASPSAPAAMPAVQSAISRPYPRSPTSSDSVANTTIAAGVAVMNSSDTNTTPTARRRSGSLTSSTIPSRARPAGAAAAARRAGRVFPASTAPTAARARNVAASAISASWVPPLAASSPPSAGPSMNPA